MATHPTPVLYRIDADGVLASVGGGFADFARENGAPGLERRVVGTPLNDWIEGPRVRHVYGALIERARQSGAPVRVPFRCDAPGIERVLSMEIRATGDGGIEFECATESTRSRPPIAALDPAVPRGDETLAMCAWCKAIRLDDWIELEDAIGALGPIGSAPPAFTHGICDACLARMDSAVG